MKITLRQLKGLIKEAVATSFHDSTVEDTVVLADQAHASLAALKGALETVATNRGYDGQMDADSWDRAAELVASLADQLDSIDVLSHHEQSGEIDDNSNTNMWKRKPR